MICDNCKCKDNDRRGEEKEFYECDICRYLICEKCCHRQSKRCRKCEDGRLQRV